VTPLAAADVRLVGAFHVGVCSISVRERRV
jgi:hypothetical protein